MSCFPMSHGTGVRIVLKETGINLIMFLHGRTSQSLQEYTAL